MIYVFLRILGVPLALAGWFVYQWLIKKKNWSQLRPDMQVMIFVIAVWAVVYFVLLK